MIQTSKTMGCCFCRPDTEVLYDPSVTAHATVGDIALDKACTYSDPTIKGCEGLLYIKETVTVAEKDTAAAAWPRMGRIRAA